MEKVYLVIQSWSNDSDFDIQSILVYKNYEDARKEFLKIKEEIKNLNTGYDEIEDSEDYYCESINGEYIYNHELVYIEEQELL